MSWDDYRLGKEYIGETIDKGFGYSQNFITLPENQVYDSGYGFFISSKLASEEEISLPDDYKVELIMNPELREEGKRYKRYKISGLELKEQVLEPYMDVLLEKQIKAQKEKDRRNKKVMGNIVLDTIRDPSMPQRIYYRHISSFMMGFFIIENIRKSEM